MLGPALRPPRPLRQALCLPLLGMAAPDRLVAVPEQRPPVPAMLLLVRIRIWLELLRGDVHITHVLTRAGAEIKNFIAESAAPIRGAVLQVCHHLRSAPLARIVGRGHQRGVVRVPVVVAVKVRAIVVSVMVVAVVGVCWRAAVAVQVRSHPGDVICVLLRNVLQLPDLGLQVGEPRFAHRLAAALLSEGHATLARHGSLPHTPRVLSLRRGCSVGRQHRLEATPHLLGPCPHL